MTLLVLVALLSFSFSIPEKVSKKADKVIAKFYETDDFSKSFLQISSAVNEQTPADFTSDNFFKIESNGTLLGYGYIGNAPSKTATFDYLVLFDQDFIIAKSKVLVYREEYGGEIGSKRWLKQFIGHSSQTGELRYNQEIIPISGATISVRSMTRSINELLKSIGTLQQLKSL